MLRSYLCEYSDAYIVVKGTIDLLLAAANENDNAPKNVAFKNNAPLRLCILKINSTLIDNAEDLDIVIIITLGRLWNCYRDKIDDVDDNASDGKSISFKTNIIGKTPQRPARLGNEGDANRPPRPLVPALNVEVTVPLKYLSNFVRSFDLPLINCKIELALSWIKVCVLIQHHNNVKGTNSMITSTKLYVPVVVLENIKQGFKRTIFWNKYRSEIIA